MNEQIRRIAVALTLELSWYFGLALSAYGGLLVVLGLLEMIQPGWVPPNLKPISEDISGVMTLLGTSIATISIYAPPNDREPDWKSKNRTGPAILILLFFVLIVWVLSGRPSNDILNGVAMLGLGVSTLRLMSQRERSF